MTDGIFDASVAPQYDAIHATSFDPSVLGPTIDRLVELAGGGPALEFASGTGRVCVPLSQRGIEVHGIELSRPMVEEMLAKPEGEAVPVTIGDMATTRVDARFRLVYLVYNTIGNLVTQDDQVACFQNAADHLEPGGLFLIELMVPQLQYLPPGETGVVFELSDGYIGVDEYDVVTQRLTSHHYRVNGDRGRRFDTPQRYAWPAELDLMARLAGMELRHRWADWDRSPFTANSPSHISVWEKL